MDTSRILLQAMFLCAREYNARDLLDWGDRLTYNQQSEHLAEKLRELGYVLVKESIPLVGEKTQKTEFNG